MKYKKSLNSGFIGILMLLVGVTVMVFLMIKSITALQKGGTENNINTNNSIQDIGGGLAPIDGAKDVKNLIEQNNTRTMKQLN